MACCAFTMWAHFMKSLIRPRCLLLFALLLLPMQGCRVTYTGYFHGQVVDGETGMPLPGVIVVSGLNAYKTTLDRWELLEEFNPDAYETVTDKDGRYAVLSRAPDLDWRPALKFFKPNYYPPGGDKDWALPSKYDTRHLDDYWVPPGKLGEHGWIVRMMPFKGDNWQRYTGAIGGLWNGEGSDCVVNCPRFVLALQAETERLERVMPKDIEHVHVPDPWRMISMSEKHREFLLKYGQEHPMGGENGK